MVDLEDPDVLSSEIEAAKKAKGKGKGKNDGQGKVEGKGTTQRFPEATDETLIADETQIQSDEEDRDPIGDVEQICGQFAPAVRTTSPEHSAIAIGGTKATETGKGTKGRGKGKGKKGGSTPAAAPIPLGCQAAAFDVALTPSAATIPLGWQGAPDDAALAPCPIPAGGSGHKRGAEDAGAVGNSPTAFADLLQAAPEGTGDGGKKKKKKKKKKKTKNGMAEIEVLTEDAGAVGKSLTALAEAGPKGTGKGEKKGRGKGRGKKRKAEEAPGIDAGHPQALERRRESARGSGVYMARLVPMGGR